MANKEREELARYLLQHSADDAPPYEVAIDYGKPVSQMQARIERLEAALDAIIDKIGEVSVSSRSADYMNAMDGLEAIARDARGE